MSKIIIIGAGQRRRILCGPVNLDNRTGTLRRQNNLARLRAGAVGHRGLPAVLGQRDDPVRGRLHALLNPVPRRGTIVDEEYRAFLLGGKAFAS